jgi:hypothetical protein
MPEPGDVAEVRVPAWLIAKHRQLQELRYQRALAFPQPAGLDPAKLKGHLPMADNRDIGSGFIARDEKHEPGSKRPEFTGKIRIRGEELRIVGWTREKNGRKYLSLAVSEIEQQRQEEAPRERYDQRAEREQENSYAAAKSGESRREPARYGGGMPPDGEVPF